MYPSNSIEWVDDRKYNDPTPAVDYIVTSTRSQRSDQLVLACCPFMGDIAKVVRDDEGRPDYYTVCTPGSDHGPWICHTYEEALEAEYFAHHWLALRINALML